MTDEQFSRLLDLQGKINEQSIKIIMEIKSIMNHGIRLEHLNNLMEISDNLKKISIDIVEKDLNLPVQEKNID